MLPAECQIGKLTGEQCGKMPKGFVVCPGDSPMAIYKEGTILCTRHGEAVQEVTPDSQFVTVSELADLMTNEDKTSQRQQTSIDTITTEDTPMNTPVVEQEVVVMTVLPNAPVDLQALAHKVNGNSVDIPRPPAASIEAPKPAEQAPAVPSQPLSDVEQLKEQIRKLQEQVKAAEQAERERQAAEAHAKMVAADPFYLLSQASALRVSLFLQGGSAALAAVETLMASGILTVRHGALVVAKTEQGTKKQYASDPATVARRQIAEGTGETKTVEDSERAALRAKVRQYIAMGWKDSDIAKSMDLPSSTVYSIRKRLFAKAA